MFVDERSFIEDKNISNQIITELEKMKTKIVNQETSLGYQKMLTDTLVTIENSNLPNQTKTRSEGLDWSSYYISGFFCILYRSTLTSSCPPCPPCESCHIPEKNCTNCLSTGCMGVLVEIVVGTKTRPNAYKMR